ncbi:hypothetical protein F2Q68_00011799 [Brassica cretica]|uniref:Uncharacterized protein n=1 Tax=Brassica cretica TaxID=69181 RepID=A0A8S9KVW8_BRACR|nr:hypothetical protein F2Q68_00011799 [Brassica cretica]
MGVVARGETISPHVVRDLRNELEVASSEETRSLGKIPGDEYNKVFEILLHQILEELKQLNVKSAPPPEVPLMKTHDWETPHLENTRTIMGTVAGLLATVALTGVIAFGTATEAMCCKHGSWVDEMDGRWVDLIDGDSDRMGRW